MPIDRSRLRWLAALASLFLATRSAPAQIGGSPFCEEYFELGFVVNCSEDALRVRFANGTNVDLSPTSPFEIEVVADIVSPGVSGWSYALSHDPSVLRLVEGSMTTDGTDAAARFVAPFFDFHRTIDPGGDSRPGFVSVVILSFSAPRNWLEPAADLSLGRASYEIVGPIPSSGTLLRFEDDLARVEGSEPILTRLLVQRFERGPRSVLHGVLGDGQIAYRGEDAAPLERICHTDEACREDRFEICFGGVDGPHAHSTALDGETIEVTVVLDTVSDDLAGFNLAVSHDPTVLTLDRQSVTSEGTDVESFPPFTLIHVVSEGSDDLLAGIVTAAAPSADSAGIIRPGRNTLLFARYRVTGEIPERGTLLRFQHRESLGPPSIAANLALVRGPSTAPLLPRFAQHGLVVRGGVFGGRFRRGDADGSGGLSVSDAVQLVAFVRGEGGTRDQICLDALDADDNGRVDFIDAAALLRFLFAQAAPLAPPSIECGVDPTSDALDCRVATCE